MLVSVLPSGICETRSARDCATYRLGIHRSPRHRQILGRSFAQDLPGCRHDDVCDMTKSVAELLTTHFFYMDDKDQTKVRAWIGAVGPAALA